MARDVDSGTGNGAAFRTFSAGFRYSGDECRNRSLSGAQSVKAGIPVGTAVILLGAPVPARTFCGTPRELRRFGLGRTSMLASAFVAVVVFPVTMMIQAIVLALTVRFVDWLVRVGYAGPTFWHNLTVTIGVTLMLLMALLAQVAV